MSIAYPIKKVKIMSVTGLGGLGIQPGSSWRTGNVLFLAAHAGAELRATLDQCAEATGPDGRGYLLWVARHPRAPGLVIQPLDSHYCYEVFQEEGPAS